ncbi:MAG: DUF1330 domain-containing protein [Halioglobus sp.]
MEVKNAVLPNKEQIEGFFEPDDGTPVYMVNLLKFKDKAEYEDGRETDLTGEEAYHLYGDEVAKIVESLGGSITFTSSVRRLTLGEVDELWDKVAIAMYPSRTAMFEMMQHEKIQEIGQHRTAGLAGQLNLETVLDAL